MPCPRWECVSPIGMPAIVRAVSPIGMSVPDRDGSPTVPCPRSPPRSPLFVPDRPCPCVPDRCAVCDRNVFPDRCCRVPDRNVPDRDGPFADRQRLRRSPNSRGAHWFLGRASGSIVQKRSCQRFHQVIESCSVVASDTQTRYGTCAIATQRWCFQTTNIITGIVTKTIKMSAAASGRLRRPN